MTKDLKHFYQNNDRFRSYVDRCAANDGVVTYEILDRAMTREVVNIIRRQMRKRPAGFRRVSLHMRRWGECV